jgi:hypothetical protein
MVAEGTLFTEEMPALSLDGITFTFAPVPVNTLAPPDLARVVVIDTAAHDNSMRKFKAHCGEGSLTNTYMCLNDQNSDAIRTAIAVCSQLWRSLNSMLRNSEETRARLNVVAWCCVRKV